MATAKKAPAPENAPETKTPRATKKKPDKAFDRTTATDIQVIGIKTVKIRMFGAGYTSPGNAPNGVAMLEVAGLPYQGCSVKRFVLRFYPTGDRRLSKPFYNEDKTEINLSQPVHTLPGWIASLQSLPRAHGVALAYYAKGIHYEFECLRTLTDK